MDLDHHDLDRILHRLDKRDLDLFHLEMSAKRTALRANRLAETIRCRRAVAALRRKGGIGVLLKTLDDWCLVEADTIDKAQAKTDRLLRSRPDIAGDMYHGDGARVIIQP
jgi:hypothetical protein